jgi:microcin C transport system substrate-binding protein
MSSTSEEKGSDNFIGLSDPLIDSAIKNVISSETREELKLASKVLDRILLFGHYVIPHWHNRVHRVAYRNGLIGPKNIPLYYHSEDWAMSSWWWQNQESKQ